MAVVHATLHSCCTQAAPACVPKEQAALTAASCSAARMRQSAMSRGRCRSPAGRSAGHMSMRHGALESGVQHQAGLSAQQPITAQHPRVGRGTAAGASTARPLCWHGTQACPTCQRVQVIYKQHIRGAARQRMYVRHIAQQLVACTGMAWCGRERHGNGMQGGWAPHRDTAWRRHGMARHIVTQHGRAC